MIWKENPAMNMRSCRQFKNPGEVVEESFLDVLFEFRLFLQMMLAELYEEMLDG